MTEEQRASVDKALAKTQLSRDIGGATDVQGPPTPHDTNSLDKARDVGQDLHKQGVTLDKG